MGRGGRGGGEGGPLREPGKASDFLTHKDVRDGTINKEGGVAGEGEGGGASARVMEKEHVRCKKMLGKLEKKDRKRRVKEERRWEKEKRRRRGGVITTTTRATMMEEETVPTTKGLLSIGRGYSGSTAAMPALRQD